jgi:L-iditol 2-dehydrogenase
LSDEPKPISAHHETLIRVTAVGICGSDLHWLDEGAIGDAQLYQSLILGHEFAGVTSDGTRVAVDPSIPCGKCEFYLEGNPNACIALRFAGHSMQDGALREFMAWDTQCLYPLPDSLTYVDGAMLEPLGVALHAVDLGHLKPGMSIGVFGCGPIGLLILQLARLYGATSIFATEKLAHRLDAARAMGATYVIDADGDESNKILSMTKGRGVDVAFEVAGAQRAVDAAIASAKPGARVVLVGIPDNDQTSITASVARRKGLTIKLSRRMKCTFPRAIELVASGKIDVRSIVTHRFALAEFDKAFSIAQKRERLKVVIEPSGG